MMSDIYTNPPCNDRIPYHKMTEKTTSHIDTRTKVCYTCSRKAIIVIDKTYYCANCGLQKLTKGLNVLRKKRKDTR